MDTFSLSPAQEQGARARTQTERARAIPERREPFLKYPIDVALALTMLIFGAPVFALISLLIKREDGGPIFYTQERWGRRGETFRVYKFRTMVPNSDEVYGIRQASHDDERITRVGKTLRAMGLDELPQLVNILKGEMSFVGPRALAIGELVNDGGGNMLTVEQVPGFYERLAVRPGLTSVATIYLPKDAPPRKKFAYDLLYVKQQSTALDLQLIAISFWVSFRGKWETRAGKV
ncbi:MAG TPA: sugar transferase [Anaerolineae bacterium]|nr:sugar transferase [Anaerolineae bacterium]